MESLAELTPRDAVDALDRLEQGMQGGRVRNPAAYLAGVLRRGSRVRAEHGPGPDPPEPYHRDEPPPSADPRSQITPAAEAKLREVGVLSGPNALDDRSLGTLLRNPPEVQYVIADAFTTRRLEGIRSMSGQKPKGCVGYCLSGRVRLRALACVWSLGSYV